MPTYRDHNHHWHDDDGEEIVYCCMCALAWDAENLAWTSHEGKKFVGRVPWEDASPPPQEP